MKKKSKYTKDMPRAMYTYFLTYSDKASAPSFSKFARSIGRTLSDITDYRRHAEFDRAYRECNEIRRDYLIDAALTKRFDPSFTKYLLSEAEDNAESERDDGISFTLEVLSEVAP